VTDGGFVSERERLRAEERERRSAERAQASQERSDRRAAEREEASRLREAAREGRLKEDEERRAALAEARDARPKRRASGSLSRTGEEKIVRDTRNYRTNKDVERMRLLSRRGAKPEALATVFNVTLEEVLAALAED
jgi:hypothetical protein